MIRYRHLRFEKTRHGKTLIYFRRGKGPRYRMPGDINSNAFRNAYFLALAGEPQQYTPQNIAALEQRKAKVRRVIKGAMRSARTRARQKNVPFDLSADFLIGMLEQQEYRCALTGIRFFTPNRSSSRVDPFTPSIDRTVPQLGYVPGNVRLVVYAANAMLLDWGEELFLHIARSVETNRKHRKAAPEWQKPAPDISANDFIVLEDGN